MTYVSLIGCSDPEHYIRIQIALYGSTIADGVARTRAAESECDRLRNDVIETVFDGEHGADPLIYRELASLMDEIVDTMEDVTDQLIFITGNRQWIDIEP